MTTPESLRRRQRTTNRLLTLVLGVLVLGGCYQVFYENPRLSDEIHTEAQSHVALCALRADLNDRVEQTENFLNHPQRFPEFNDPKLLRLTRSQVQGQKRTIAALSVLHCG